MTAAFARPSPRDGAAVAPIASKRFMIAVIGLALTASPGMAAAQGKRSGTFRVFDGTLYQGKPNLAAYGMEPIDILYASWFWRGAAAKRARARGELPTRAVVTAVARRIAQSRVPLVIDIEHWPLNGPYELMRANLDKYEQVLQWVRDAAPGAKVGYFDRAPTDSYDAALAGPHSARYRQWQQRNADVGELSARVDAIYPPLYAYSTDQGSWVRYAMATLNEARRYGKPVYAFLWPRYERPGHQHLSVDFWRLQLETARKYADGVVIWGGYQVAWDDSAPWWQATKGFLQQLGRVPGRLTPPRPVNGDE